MQSELNIGIDVSRIYRGDRGIPICTRNILREFGQIKDESLRYTLLHYPEFKPDTDFGICSPRYAQIPYKGEYVPWLRIPQEQIVYPLFQKRLGLDVFWHPQNHGQWVTPVGYVVTLHDIFPMVRPELAEALGVDVAHMKVLSNTRINSCVGADAVITVSEFSRREIAKNTPIKAEKIHVVHMGLDHDTFFPGSKDKKVMGKYNLPEKYLLTVGSYAPHKNLNVMLDAYYQSDLPNNGYGFVMVGPKDGVVYTTNVHELENQVNDNLDKGKVIMLGSVPLNDLASIYRSADLFSIASIYEGFGLPPIEAMASGVPVVASNKTSIPEICGDKALYCDPYDVQGFANHFNTLIADHSLEELLRREGLDHASKFNWQKAANQTLTILKNVANNRKK